MRKWLSKIVACTLAFVSTFGLVACGGGGDSDGDLLDSMLADAGLGKDEEEKVVDRTKTQLTVKYYNAGFGDAWLNKLIKRFEEAYKDVEYEDNKKGVQVWATGEMKTYTGQDVANGSFDVYFMENAEYYALTSVDGALEELTNIVTLPVKGADGTNLDGGKTIESKLTQQQKEFYGITSTDGDPKYYGIPHYEGGWGLVYNKELFDKEGYYVVDGAEFDILANNPGATKSKGPDGKANTADDGLPATLEEFYLLCDEISLAGDYPLCWSGQYREAYLTTMINTLVAESVGAEQMELNLSFTGEAQNLVVFDDNGIVYEDGKIKTEKVNVTTANGYEMARQEAKYYALDFLDRIINTNGWCNRDKAFNDTHSHLDAQYDFIRGGTELDPDGKAYAFLVDGPWWEGEATAKFTQMTANNQKYSKQNRNFAWMPLPKVTEDYIGGKNVYLDDLKAVTVVKAGLGDKKAAAFDFVRFSVTDESLVEFTQTTGALKSYLYTMNDEQKSVLSPFAKSLIEYKENASTFVFNSGEAFFVGNADSFGAAVDYYKAGTYTSPVQAFAQGVSAEDYFQSICTGWANRTIWE